MILRDYQSATVRYIFGYAEQHVRGRLLVVIPPGGGKTPIAAHVLRSMAAEQGLRGLAWAHRRELVTQMYDHLVECGIPTEMIGVVMRDDRRHNPAAPIQVGSVDTLRRREKPLADIIVSDEAHRDASDGRRKLRALYPDAFHLGFTGTPTRLDGRGLRADYDDLYVGAFPSALIAEGHIVAPKIYTVPKELLPDLKGVKKRGGDFVQDELEQRSNRRALIGGIVDHWIRRAGGRRTIVFPVSIRHSRAIVSRFRGEGISAEHIDGDTKLSHRIRILDGLKTGLIPVVSSCGVLSEGINIPEVKCVIQAAATESLARHIQQPGRCMRPWGNIEPILLDHAGNTIRHGPPYFDHDWSLDEDDATSRNASKGVMRECPGCHLFVAGGCLTCPECSAALGARGSPPVEKDGELKEWRPAYSEEEKQAWLMHVNQFAANRGFGQDWVKKVYFAKFGALANA